MFDINNDLGQIHFSRNVIYKICEDAAATANGAVTILNYKSRYTGRKTGLFSMFSQGEEENNDIQIDETDQGVEITVYIVVRFGTSMKAAAEGMINHIYEQMEYVLNQRPAKVKIIVTGTVSKDIAKRHIEFSR